MSPVKQAAQRQASYEAKNTMESSLFGGSSHGSIRGYMWVPKVRHDRFGEGEIVSIEGEGGNAKARWPSIISGKSSYF